MTLTDRTLLERWISHRDAEAFNELVSRHAGLVYGACKRVVRNQADAEDIAQNCFLKLARAPVPPRSSLLGWLHAVATRSAVDFLRERSRRKERERAFAEARAAERSSAQTIEELKEHVDECIARLPAELRDVIVAHFLERKPQDEVAASLGLSRQTVSYRIGKGIERLGFHLKKRGVIVPAASLASWLGQSMVEAAPAQLLASLGRLALAGPTLATAAGQTAAVLLLANVGASLMAKKVMISAAVAVVLLLAATFVALRPRGVDPEAAPSFAGVRPDRAPAAEARPAAGAGLAESPAASKRAETAKAGEAAVVQQAALSGRVLDQNGQPVVGARVIAAVPEGNRLGKALETTTDEAGRFRLASAGLHDATIFGFKSGVGLGAASGESAAPDITLEPLCEMSGRVSDLDTGAGIGGAALTLAPSPSGGVMSEATRLHFQALKLFKEIDAFGASTDSGGRFVLKDLIPLGYAFMFDPNSSEYVLPGFRRDDSRPEVRLEPGEKRSNVDFALQKGGIIAGTVYGPDGSVVPDAQVEILASYSTTARRVLLCDKEGAYRFTGVLPNATYVIGASHGGLPPGESETVVMPTAETIEGVDIHLVRGHSVAGRLVDDLGQPIPGVFLGLSRPSESDRRKTYEQGKTADDGSFRYEHVAPGEHVIHFNSSSHLAGEPFAFTMPPDRDLSGLEVVLRRKASGFISGRVVDHTGKPVAGFPVNAGLGMKPVARALSGEDGAFRLEGLGDAETYTITGYSGEYWSSRQLAVALYSTDLTLVVIKRGRIAGRVTQAATGKPVEHFELRAAFIRTEPGGGENRFHTKWTPYDSPNGEFSIERAEPVDCEIQVRADGYIEAKSARFTVPPGETAPEVVVPLARGASVLGTVVDSETGEPVPGVLIRAHQHDDFFPGLLEEGKASYAPRGVWKVTMSKADGGFDFNGLVPGESINLVAWKDGYGASVRPGIAVPREGNTVRMEVARAAKLVIFASFTPQPGQRYEFHAHHREEKPWRAAFRTGGAAERPGTVEIANLPAGLYRLAVYAVTQAGADASRRLVGEERLKLSAGERREVSFDAKDFAERFAGVSGKVIGRSDFENVRLNLISADDADEAYAFAPITPGPDGRFHFTGLPAGKYIIVAGTTAQPPAQARLPVQVGERQDLEVELSLK